MRARRGQTIALGAESEYHRRGQEEGRVEVQLTRWGGGLGMRIPEEMAIRLGLSEGAKVNVDAEGDRIVVSVARPRYRIEDLVADLTHDDLAGAFDWGPDQGREVID